MITQKQKVNLVSSLEYDGFEFTIINHPKGLEAVKDDKLQKLFANYRSIVKQIKTHIQYDQTLQEIEKADRIECESPE